MYHNKFFNVFCCVLLIFSSACKNNPRTFPNAVYQFDLQQIAKTRNALSNEWIKSAEFDENVLSFTVAEDNNELVLTPTSDDIDWSAAKYLVCEVWHDNPYSIVMQLQFFRKIGDDIGASRQGEETRSEAGPRITCVIGILPRLKTQMVFPLSHLDGQNIFLTRQPRQLKGTVFGSRLNPDDVGKVSIRIVPNMAPDFLPNIQIGAAYLTTELPEPLENLAVAVVDSFGQWTARDWPSKVRCSNELKATMHKTEAIAASAALPDEWSKYGGWKQLQFKATGFFYTHHDGNRWWFVDPEGYAFLSAGITCIAPFSSGLLTGQEELFSWLPPEDDDVFAAAYSTERNLKQIDFLKINLMSVYGSEWREKWEEIAVGLMRHWRVNTVANWSDIGMARRSRTPYVFNMSNFPTTPVKLYRDFPDVFDPAYREAAGRFAEQLRPFSNDPYLIGYFLQNEPHWAFGDNNIAFEMFATNTPSFTKKEMTRWLRKKYGNIQSFNEAWRQSLESFDALESLTMRDSPSEAAWNDLAEFSGLMVDSYVEIVCREVKKVAPNHLNLGMRYAWISSELCFRAGAWFDVFSVNGYGNPGPPATEEIARRSGKPVLIGEWHFGSALDRGLPATGIQAAESQTARGEAYRYYFENGIARPELIAIHWFQWNDQPILGRFDGENYNIGFLDVCMQMYTGLSEQATMSHERMYHVATGREQPFDKVIRRVPSIFY